MINCQICYKLMLVSFTKSKFLRIKTQLVLYTAGKHYYGVSIMNGKQIGAGTSAPNVFICLVGQNGNSGKLRITDWLSIFGVDSIHRDTWDNLIIESSEDLGEILVVILGIDKGNLLKDPWYVNEVGIYNFQSKNQQAFPCYHWIQSGTSVSFTSKTGKYVTLS